MTVFREIIGRQILNLIREEIQPIKGRQLSNQQKLKVMQNKSRYIESQLQSLTRELNAFNRSLITAIYIGLSRAPNAL